MCGRCRAVHPRARGVARPRFGQVSDNDLKKCGKNLPLKPKIHFLLSFFRHLSDES
jgi:hypothetical protein